MQLLQAYAYTLNDFNIKLNFNKEIYLSSGSHFLNAKYEMRIQIIIYSIK